MNRNSPRQSASQKKSTTSAAAPAAGTVAVLARMEDDDEEIVNGFKMVEEWDVSTMAWGEPDNEPPAMDAPKVEIAVEILLHPASGMSHTDAATQVSRYLRNNIFGAALDDEPPREISVKELSRVRSMMTKALQEHISEVVFEASDERPVVLINGYDSVKWSLYIYKMEAKAAVQGEIAEEMPAATHEILPSADFQRLWQSLVYDTPVKQELLSYAIGTVLFSKLNIDSDLITWNKVILLHGPPGTGKTSLCKALAQKLSIRMSEHFPGVYFVEINIHSLFSKWFSESGKLVTKMFNSIENIIKQKNAPLVCLLLDEVESLARSRQASVTGSEPSDALRAVNALLTQLDKIKKYSNVLIFTTSNISEAIDVAFVDRADIKQYIGNPSSAARDCIFLSCLEELVKKGVLLSSPGLLVAESSVRAMLRRISGNLSEGMSGRSLRKMPFLTHALRFSGRTGVDMKLFLEGMELTIAKHQSDLLAMGRTVATK
ncbi:Pachytene checkpoint protein 2-like protein [Hypsibius exemplaris]|uniref:Pachytene checkpoint protein 2-like protein n=1 Tax=Hypsibius exemplaris TaxID=2072580 RepID=A0A1W0X1G5_HYPEX|nr:Pachytene checkpoint protein 2-like protein [Hypsibius exemplaris]